MRTILTLLIISTTAGCNLFETVRTAEPRTIPIDKPDFAEDLNADTSTTNDAGTKDATDLVDLADMKALYPETCFDGLISGNESDFDCGGDCQTCADGRACGDALDCSADFCENSICVAEASDTCKNGVIDSTETGIDCGGNCSPCVADGEPWWQPQWNQRKKVSFQVGQTASDVRVLIALAPTPGLEPSDVRFVLNGDLLASEIDEAGSLSFWVLFPTLVSGPHELLVYSHSSDPTLSPPESPWENRFAVYHSPDKIDAQMKLSAPISNASKVGGIFNEATDFDGTSHVLIADPQNKLDELFPTISITAWIKPVPAEPTWQIVTSRQYATDYLDDFSFGLGNGALGGCIESGCVVADTPIPLNQWSYIAYVYDGTFASIYLNGKLQKTRALTRTRAPLANKLLIGGNQNSTGDSTREFFFGIIDEVRFTSKIISPATLLTEFQSQASGFFTFGPIQTRPVN